MSAGDLGITENTILSKKIKYYLFGKLSRDSGKASDYINSVNIIYSIIRSELSELAHLGKLSAKQTIIAKKIISTLNKESVESMVKLLSLNDTAMSPDELVSLIKTKRTDGTLSFDVELQIKEVVYFKKLYAIKALVLLLHLSRYNIDIPKDTPADLMDVIFTPGLEYFEKTATELPPPKANNEDASRNDMMMAAQPKEFFCMACFHRSYTEWKRQNGIN